MKGIKKFLPFTALLVCTAFIFISQNVIKSCNGDEIYAQSPIHENRLTDTLNAWENQGRIINLVTRKKKLDNDTIEEVKKRLKGLAYEVQRKGKALG